MWNEIICLEYGSFSVLDLQEFMQRSDNTIAQLYFPENYVAWVFNLKMTKQRLIAWEGIGFKSHEDK